MKATDHPATLQTDSIDWPLVPTQRATQLQCLSVPNTDYRILGAEGQKQALSYAVQE